MMTSIDEDGTIEVQNSNGRERVPRHVVQDVHFPGSEDVSFHFEVQGGEFCELDPGLSGAHSGGKEVDGMAACEGERDELRAEGGDEGPNGPGGRMDDEKMEGRQMGESGRR